MNTLYIQHNIIERRRQSRPPTVPCFLLQPKANRGKRKTKNKVFDSEEGCMNSIEKHLAEISKEDIFRICQI